VSCILGVVVGDSLNAEAKENVAAHIKLIKKNKRSVFPAFPHRGYKSCLMSHTVSANKQRFSLTANKK